MPKKKEEAEPQTEAPEETTPGDPRLDAVASPVESEQTEEEAAEAQMGAPGQAFEPAGRPEGVCANCGEPSAYRTTSQGAEVVEFCEQHRPEEGVEPVPQQQSDDEGSTQLSNG